MMQNTSRSIALVILIAAVVVAGTSAVIWRLYRGDGSLLRDVAVGLEEISPNADGSQDITEISYTLSRNAYVSIYFENEAGERYFFRNSRARGAGDYAVFFSGVVDGYRQLDDRVEGEILTRLLQNGRYTWIVEAVDLDGVRESQQGEITIIEADTQLPELRNFVTDKDIFTPNRDGINDRMLLAYDLQKEADVRVYLITPDGGELDLAERERNVPPGMPGRHEYDYEGGVDNGETPPPDGLYQVVALAEDEEGQKIRVETQLEIALGGVPRADIVAPATSDQFEVSATAIQICDTLFFTLTVENYGETPIRTTGPAPGTVYDSDWNYNTLGWFTESGAWRVAVGFENEIKNYPFRWAVGREADLAAIDGHLYLMPGQRGLVTGGIRVVDVFGERNPQPVWAGLIHEDVEVSQFNDRVDRKDILVELPDPDNIIPCEAREIPNRPPTTAQE